MPPLSGLPFIRRTPAGFYADPILRQPYTYQNGGNWCWFGGRMVQQLIRFGMLEDAYLELKPLLARVLRVGNFYEWWTPDNQPRGSAGFRGAPVFLALPSRCFREPLVSPLPNSIPLSQAEGKRSDFASTHEVTVHGSLGSEPYGETRFV